MTHTYASSYVVCTVDLPLNPRLQALVDAGMMSRINGAHGRLRSTKAVVKRVKASATSGRAIAVS